jgi:hypothetical protein
VTMRQFQDLVPIAKLRLRLPPSLVSVLSQAVTKASIVHNEDRNGIIEQKWTKNEDQAKHQSLTVCLKPTFKQSKGLTNKLSKKSGLLF